jgi:predicted acetyltransferase
MTTVGPKRMNPKIEYLPDNSVTDSLDHELRGLLTTCFTKPQDVVFRDRRYFREPYPHRWVIRDESDAIVAHIGVHEKQVEAEGRTYCIGGIAEVCVQPIYRGKGYVRMMLKSIHAWLSKHGFAFAILFGDTHVYRSSGYVQITNLFLGGSQRGRKQMKGMIRDLSGTPWPRGDMHLYGLGF